MHRPQCIRPKSLAVRTDSKTDRSELILKGMPYQLESKCHGTIVHGTVINCSQHTSTITCTHNIFLQY